MANKVIKIRKGDSTDFFYGIKINLKGVGDLTGWQAYCQIGRVLKEYPDISEGFIPFILDAKDTDQLDIGSYKVYVKFIRPDGAVGTSTQYFTIEVYEEVVDVG